MHFFKKFFDAANQSAEAVNRQIIAHHPKEFGSESAIISQELSKR